MVWLGNTFYSRAGTWCRSQAFRAPAPSSRGFTQSWNQCDWNPHLPDSVADGKEMLDRLEREGGGLVGEAVQQGLLQGQMGRVQGLEDVRLQTVAEEAWWQNMAVLC